MEFVLDDARIVNFDHRNAVRADAAADAGNKVPGVGHVGQDVAGDHHVGRSVGFDDLFGRQFAKKRAARRYAAFFGHLNDVFRRVNAENPMPVVAEGNEERSVVAGDFQNKLFCFRFGEVRHSPLVERLGVVASGA